MKADTYSPTIRHATEHATRGERAAQDQAGRTGTAGAVRRGLRQDHRSSQDQGRAGRVRPFWSVKLKSLAFRHYQYRDSKPAQTQGKAYMYSQISLLKAQITSHATSHAKYLSIAQARADMFAPVPPLVDQVKTMRIPIDATSADEDAAAGDSDAAAGGGGGASASGTGAEGVDAEVDEPSNKTRLSGAAFPFIPPAAPSGSGSRSGSGPAVTHGTRAKSAGGRTTTSPQPLASSSSSSAHLVPPPNQRTASHTLPTRPSGSRQPSSSALGGTQPSRSGRSTSASAAGVPGMTSTEGGGGAGGRSLPTRPKSGLRNSATPGREEGEVDGQEEGEVDDQRRSKRRSGRR